MSVYEMSVYEMSANHFIVIDCMQLFTIPRYRASFTRVTNNNRNLGHKSNNYTIKFLGYFL